MWRYQSGVQYSNTGQEGRWLAGGSNWVWARSMGFPIWENREWQGMWGSQKNDGCLVYWCVHWVIIPYKWEKKWVSYCLKVGVRLRLPATEQFFSHVGIYFFAKFVGWGCCGSLSYYDCCLFVHFLGNGTIVPNSELNQHITLHVH